MKSLNTEALFNRGYKIIQEGLISFSLVKFKYNQLQTQGNTYRKLFDFEVDNVEFNSNDIYNRLLSEIEYIIDCIKYNRDGYLDDIKNKTEFEYITTEFINELIDLRDFLK